MNMIDPTMNHAAAEGIGSELCRLGFTESAPSHISPALVAADVRIYRTLLRAAPGCGHRGHKVTPMHRGREYRLVASCRSCGNAVEC
jgi:hypothetical protein